LLRNLLNHRAQRRRSAGRVRARAHGGPARFAAQGP